MEISTKQLDCPHCGVPIAISTKTCEYCRMPIVISTISDVFAIPGNKISGFTQLYKNNQNDLYGGSQMSNKALGLCYLKIKQYSMALNAFQKAIKDDFSDADTLFFCAIAQLNGEEATWQDRYTIDCAEKFLKSALSIEQKGIYFYLFAYIRYSYYEQNFYNARPDYRYYLEQADSFGVTELDKAQLFTLLNVDNPF